MGVFEHPCFCKIGKNEGGPLETFKKFAKKSLTKPKKPAQKNFGHGRDSNPSFCLADLKKLEAEEAQLVWQLVEASL